MNCNALRHLLYAFPASFATLRVLLCERFELFTQSSMHVICHPYAEAADVAAAALVCIFRPQPYFLYFQELLPSFTVPHLLPYFRCFRWLLNAHAYCFTAILNHAAMLRFVFVFFCYWHPPARMPMSSSYISYVRRCPFVHIFIQLCAEVLTQLPSMLAVVFFFSFYLISFYARSKISFVFLALHIDAYLLPTCFSSSNSFPQTYLYICSTACDCVRCTTSLPCHLVLSSFAVCLTLYL